jgi:uridine monophosphate synthetase
MKQLMTQKKDLSFAERGALAAHPLAKRLFKLMESKQSNLGLVADVTSSRELLLLAEKLGPYLCLLKTHIDILEDFTPQVTRTLRQIADEQQFLLFEDRKFADIGNTVLQQYQGGIYRISEWAHITNAYALPGPGIIEALRQAGAPKGNGLLLLAQLSSKGNLIDHTLQEKTVQLALHYPEFVIGFICQKKLTDNPAYVHMTPGVQIGAKGDALGQQYNTPQHVIYEMGSDIALVGRGILQAPDPAAAAQIYREASWSAYTSRV